MHYQVLTLTDKDTVAQLSRSPESERRAATIAPSVGAEMETFACREICQPRSGRGGAGGWGSRGEGQSTLCALAPFHVHVFRCDVVDYCIMG